MRRKDRIRLNSKGFSLVELIIVIAIMAVLAGTIAPALIKYLEKSRKTTDMSNATEIEKILVRGFVEGYIDIPEAKRTVGYGAWVMLCNKDKKNAPTPYHNRNFSGVWCGADAGVIVGDVESQGDWNYCTELADLLNEEGININSARSYSRGGDDGWDWIIIQVCYNSEGRLCSRVYSGFKNQDGSINKTADTNIEKELGRGWVPLT